MIRHAAPHANWIAAAQRLRSVRRASLLFLDLWITGLLGADIQAARRFAADVAKAGDEQLADPNNHNWKLLYRGSILDD